MGVPGFFLWLWKNYKARNFVFTKSNIPKVDETAITNVDYLLLDMNCMIHPVCFETIANMKNHIDIDKLENKMINNVIIYLEKLISIGEPKKGIYIAIDGVAPVAKMKQQRLRRYKSIHDNELYNKIIGAFLSILLYKYLIGNFGFYGAAYGQTLSWVIMGLISIVSLFYAHNKLKSKKID